MSVRCAAGVPLAPNATTDQKEDTCTLQDIKKAAVLLLARSAKDLAAAPFAPGPAFALALTQSGGKPAPASFTAAQARRQYAITQPATPNCDQSSTLGAPCHCSEMVLRDAVCRSSAKLLRASTCAFQADDTAKKIFNVTYTNMPHL
jgi:hypothetical protein